MGKAWDEHETLNLLKKIRENKTIDTIAKEHERTIGGIRSRLSVLAYEFYEEGKSVEQIKKYEIKIELIPTYLILILGAGL
jgi:hypothetical protein